MMFLIWGHRGAAGWFAENTLRSIKKAIAQRVDGVEIDVMQCATKELVLHHDKTLLRLFGVRKKISDLSLEELHTLSRCQIPTLEDALLSIPKGVLVNIEIKNTGVAHVLCELIKKLPQNRRKEILVSSRFRGELEKIKLCAPDIQLGLVTFGLNPFALMWAVKNATFCSVHLACATRTVINSYKMRGLKVYVFPHGTRQRMSYDQLRGLGADGAFFNYPGKAPK